MSSSGPDLARTHASNSPQHLPVRQRSLFARLVRAWPLYLALAPTLILVGVFTYYTTAQGIQMSLL